mmetsp:Transcript_56606/g.113350  ORF Transcript_56606/g.113350 Transcript_56606/m.113350 type:complete len:216 (+) Transcript_56606:195-842(+)
MVVAAAAAAAAMTPRLTISMAPRLLILRAQSFRLQASRTRVLIIIIIVISRTFHVATALAPARTWGQTAPAGTLALGSSHSRQPTRGGPSGNAARGPATSSSGATGTRISVSPILEAAWASAGEVAAAGKTCMPSPTTLPSPRLLGPTVCQTFQRAAKTRTGKYESSLGTRGFAKDSSKSLPGPSEERTCSVSCQLGVGNPCATSCRLGACRVCR